MLPAINPEVLEAYNPENNFQNTDEGAVEISDTEEKYSTFSAECINI